MWNLGIPVLFRYINLRGLFKTKAIPVEEQYCHYLTGNFRDKEIHTFPQGISP